MKRPLICVELPCKVDNPRRAIEALGGAQEIIDTFKNEGTTTYTRRRMNFKFRPDDPHCKPTMATDSHDKNIIRHRIGAYQSPFLSQCVSFKIRSKVDFSWTPILFSRGQ